MGWLLAERARTKGLTLTLDCDPDLPSVLSGDDVRLKQIMTNLLTNGVKYTEKGSVTLSVHGEKSGNGKTLILKVAVKDTGIGIREENIDKLFMDFSRMDQVKNRHIEGTGLGLAITKLLVEAMGGQIHVESVYGKGSTFSVEIPQGIADPTPMGNLSQNTAAHSEARKTYHEKFTAPNARLLVVDDNRMNLVVFVSLLKKTGMRIDQATGGEQALELTRKQKYDSIFMDHMMPAPDGIETLHMLRGEEGNPNKDTVTIALTANAIAGIDRMYLSAGFQDYLSKPVEPQKLERMIMRHLPSELIEMETDDITE